jgi:N-acyl-D-amino-acid deacylase
MRTLALATIALTILSACSDDTPAPSSTLIINATVYDGTGADGVATAVRFDGERIVTVGPLAPLEGETVIDAKGLALAPGFIDTHSHHDRQLDEFRHMPGVLSQGVTMIVRGADGSSDTGKETELLTVADFNAAFVANPAAVNIASFSPHGTIRYQALGSDFRREATDKEIVAMAKLVDADMRAGALGLATGLEYEPGIYASTEELIVLSRMVAHQGGRYASHLRDEDDLFEAAIDEIIRIGREAEIPVQISHIKLADRAFWGTTDEIIAKLDAARAAGIDITADIYPYERWASDLAVLFPDRDYDNRETAEYTFEHTALPEDILLYYFPPDPTLENKNIAEIAGLLEQDEVTTLLTLSRQADDYLKETGEGGSGIIAKSMNKNDIAAFMQWPYTNFCSDGGHGGGHPRGYGAFPRVLGYFTRELGVLSLPEAIHKMTGLSARALGIEDRGRIAAGLYADLVLFDPETISDRATMQDRTAASVGIHSVWVNGVLAFQDGQPTKRYPGRIVARGE